MKKLGQRNSWVVLNCRDGFCSASVQGYPRGLPVDKPTCLSLAPKATCPQVRSTRWVTRVRTLPFRCRLFPGFEKSV